MKKIIFTLISILFLCSCTKNQIPLPSQDNRHLPEREFRAVWISCYDLQTFDYSTEELFQNDVNQKFKFIKDFGLNTVIVQVRPFADAIYPSKIFPLSQYVYKDKIPDFDVLKVMIKIAEEYDLSFHAWINPYRISNDTDTKKLETLSLDLKLTDDVVVSEKGIHFNPASLNAQKLIIDGVREIIENYDVDAIHIDDYFYPTTDESFDSMSFKVYTENGGKLTLSDWRRENVNSLISGIYTTIKSYDPDILFGISPGGNIDYNYKNLYADADVWCKNAGYIDYIIPQIYFGFKNSSKPFENTAIEWLKLCEHSRVNLYCGLALYKTGQKDEFCSDIISKNEWIENSDIIKRQIEFLRESDDFSGFALFSFRNLSNISNVNSKIEIQNIRNVL